MDVSFDYETNQKVIKLSATEEGVLIAALNTAHWYTRDHEIAELCKEMRKELKIDRN